MAEKLGVVGGTPTFYSLLENFRWIMDPGEPLNLARFVRNPDPTLIPGRTVAAKVILQEAGNDLVIPNRYTLALGKSLGLPVDAMSHLQGIDKEGQLVLRRCASLRNATHGALIDFANPTLTLQIRDQAVTYLSTGLGSAATSRQIAAKQSEHPLSPFAFFMERSMSAILSSSPSGGLRYGRGVVARAVAVAVHSGVSLSLGLGLLSGAQQAHAAGFLNSDQSPTAVGLAGAVVARPDDDAIFYNPRDSAIRPGCRCWRERR